MTAILTLITMVVLGFNKIAWASDLEQTSDIAAKNTLAIEQLTSIITNQAQSVSVISEATKATATNLEIIRIDRKADRIREKAVLTDTEQEILDDYDKDIKKLEESLKE